jgi:hypothetical protein
MTRGLLLSDNQGYLSKIGGPLLDRIDIHMEVPAVPYKELRGNPAARNPAPCGASRRGVEHGVAGREG